MNLAGKWWWSWWWYNYERQQINEWNREVHKSWASAVGQINWGEWILSSCLEQKRPTCFVINFNKIAQLAPKNVHFSTSLPLSGGNERSLFVSFFNFIVDLFFCKHYKQVFG